MRHVFGLRTGALFFSSKVLFRARRMYRFFPRLSSDLGGVWLFRIHCQEAAVLRIVKARLRHVFCLRTGALFFSFIGSPLGVPKVLFRARRMYCFLPRLSSDLSGVWLF